MSEKRRLSTRNRGEPPLKKRPLTPPPLPPPPASTETQKGLPSRLQDNQNLPILKERQDPALPDSEYQSIMERSAVAFSHTAFKLTVSSGVLASSIEQSRRKWAIDGVFERYWAKPSKKKTQEAQNPSKDSMTRLGQCSLVIEPHVFEITLYTVREPQTNYQHPNAQPASRPAASYVQPSPNPSIGTPGSLTHGHPQPHAPQLTLPPFREGFAHFDPHRSSPAVHSYSVPSPHTASTSQSTVASPTVTAEANGAQLQSPKPSPDPVIQMLATRAASDHGLKTLMKVVASGRASQAQLREFQNHIDDLNAEIQAGRGPPPLSPSTQNAPVPPPPSRPSPAPISTHNAVQTAGPSASQPSSYAQPTMSPSNYYHPYQQLVRPKSVIQYKADISAIVFDFGGSGDRFSIPRFSVLEYLPGGNQVIVSFLVIRKGDASLPGKYKENLSYYQPVTMRLSTLQPRTLEPLMKIVAPAEEVRRYMDSVFDKMSPAETSFLATRLPRPREEDPQATKERQVMIDETIAKNTYPAPNSLIPLAA